MSTVKGKLQVYRLRFVPLLEAGVKQRAGDCDLVALHYYCGADVHKPPLEEIAPTTLENPHYCL